jgi:hypothetical protein
MADLETWFGSDIAAGPNGDLLQIDGLDRSRQRILRRLLTNSNSDGFPSDYLFHPTYGAGCPRRVGETLDVNAVNAAIRSQIMSEASVAQTPLPVITVTPILNGVYVSIVYTDLETGTIGATLAFNINQ